MDLLDPSVTEALRALNVQHTAGVSLVDALNTCANVCVNSTGRASFTEAARRAADGEGIERVIGAMSQILSDAERAMINAGWQSGRVEVVLDSVVRQRELWYTTRKKVRSKMLMPAGVLLLAAFVGPLPSFVSGGISAFGYLVSVMIPLGIAFIVWRLGGDMVRKRASASIVSAEKKPLPPDTLDRLMLDIPIVRDVERNRCLSEIATLLGHLISAGVSISNALEICAKSVKNGLYRQSVSRCADVTRGGQTLTVALRGHEAHLWPQEYVAAIAVGEQSGALDETLLRLALSSRDRYMSAIEKLGDWVPKILYGCICLFMIYHIFQGASNYANTLNGIMDGK